MKTPTYFSLGALVMLMTGTVFMSAAAGTDRARAAIESQARALALASQRGDSAAMADLFTADAKISVPGAGGVVAGRTAVQGFWQAALNGGMKGLSLTTTELEGDGEMRFETGRYSARGANGVEYGSGEYLLVWKKEGGAWKIHRDYAHPGAPVATQAAHPVAPGKDAAAMPANYRAQFKALGTAFNERNSEITGTFANSVAASVERAEQLPYPAGAVFLMEFAGSRRDGEGQLVRDSAGEVLKGEILHIDVMRKTNVAGADAGWEFTSYRADGSVAIAPADAAHCADCHRNAGEGKDFVFRQRAPLTQ